MSDPWFNPMQFGAYYGAIVGGVGGSFGGLLGAIAGWCAPRGRARRPVLIAMWGFVAMGFTQLLFGLFALLSAQPYGIWYPPLLCGFLFLVVFGVLTPKMKRTYDMVTQQGRLDAPHD